MLNITYLQGGVGEK